VSALGRQAASIPSRRRGRVALDRRPLPPLRPDGRAAVGQFRVPSAACQDLRMRSQIWPRGAADVT
jgi:hypothetical protein